MISGLIVDSLNLVETARSEAAYHKFLYRCPINVKPLTQSVADLALNFGEGDITSKRKKIARPYGVSLVFAGIDINGNPKIYQVRFFGEFRKYYLHGFWNLLIKRATLQEQ